MLESQDKPSAINNIEYSNNYSNFNNDIHLETPPSQLGTIISNSNPNNNKSRNKNPKILNTKENTDSNISTIHHSKKKNLPEIYHQIIVQKIVIITDQKILIPNKN